MRASSHVYVIGASILFSILYLLEFKTFSDFLFKMHGFIQQVL